MILGILAKDGGEVLWNGSPIDTSVCNVGYLAEERGLYPKYDLMDQLIYFATLRGMSKSKAKERISGLARRLDVEEYLYPKAAAASPLQSPEQQGIRAGRASRAKSQKPLKADQLSKGNQQKIQLLVALISDPDLIILDEPFSGLDPQYRHLQIDNPRGDRRGKHISSRAIRWLLEEFCTDITILDKSKAVLQGNLNSIKKSYGRVKLTLKTEQDITEYIRQVGS